MAVTCILKENIDKLKNLIKNLSDKNQLEALLKMPTEKRIAYLERVVSKDEAALFSRELDRALASEKSNALKNLLRTNVDIKYREKKIKQNQKSAIRAFIESKLFPAKKFKETIPMSEIKEMSDKELSDLLKKTYKKEELSEVNDLIKKAIEKDKELALAKKEGKIKSAADRKAKIQRQIIERFIDGNKKKKPTRVSVPMSEILKMEGDAQLAFLKKLMPEVDAIKAQEQIQKTYTDKISAEIDAKLKNFTTLKEFNRFIDSKLPSFSSMKEGVALTSKETEKVISLTSKVQKEKAFLDKNPLDKEAQFNYGLARVDLLDYVSELKSDVKETITDFAIGLINKQRMIQLGMDLGTTLIQGAGMLTKKAKWKADLQGLKNSFSKQELRNMKARILGDPVYAIAEKSGLRMPLYETALFKKEEITMFNKFKSKNPIAKGINETLGFFERYVASLAQSRFDLFKEYIEASKALGKDVSKGSKEAEEIASAINQISGSANLGRFEKFVPEGNVLLFSIRLLTSKFKNLLLTPVEVVEHYGSRIIGKEPRLSKTVVNAKMRATAGILGASASLATLLTLSGYDVETDPRSSDFMKVKIGNRMQDISFGYGSYITFIARLMTGKTKTTEGGVIKSLRDLTEEQEAAGEVRAKGKGGVELGYGSITENFFRNKLASFPSLLLDYYLGETGRGDKPTLSTEAKDKLPPMFIADLFHILQDDETGGATKGVLSFAASIGSGGYTKTPEDFSKRGTNEMKQFVEEKGKEAAKNAGAEYSKEVSKKVAELVKTEAYQKMTNAEKAGEITSLKKDVKDEIFDKYEFIPE